MRTHHGPADLPAGWRSDPDDLESFARIVRQSQDRARELVGRLNDSAAADDPSPLLVATDEWLTAVEELEVAEQMLTARDARIAVLEAELAAESEARARAVEIGARLADLLGTLSHEVRTPLHASQGYLELLQVSGAGTLTPEQLGYLRRMEQCQAFLVAVLDGVLALSRLEHGASELELADVSVDAVLATIPALVEPQILEKQISYERVSGDAAVTVRADAKKLQQIALNLVTNAIKFTPPGGRIVVSWEACRDAVAIRVRDTGSGIRAADLERIFEPFVQGANVPASASRGVGLGLAISRQLARLMAGDLTVASTLGEGATFTLRLPRGSNADA